MADQYACNLPAPERYHDLACFIWLGWGSSPLDALLPLLCTLYRIRMRGQCTGLNLALKKFNVSLRIRYRILGTVLCRQLNILGSDCGLEQ